MDFSLSESWSFELPALTSWKHIFRWIDRWENMVYRVEDQQINMWLPAKAGDGFLRISPLSDQQIGLTLNHHGHTSRTQVEAFLTDWWDLDRDMEPFYLRFSEDPLLASSLLRHHGARIVGFPNLFEALVIGILGQQVNVQFAYVLKHRLTEAFGTSLDHDGDTWWRFPQPESILSATIPQLRDMQISNRKAEYLIGVAESMADGTISREGLKALPFQKQVETLTRLRGIGSWTAHYVCMKCLHSTDAFPAGDAGLQNAVKAHLQMERKPTPQELQTLAREWAGWEAYATWFLWMN